MIKSPLTAGNRPPPPAPFKKCIEWMFKWMFYVPMTSILTLPLLMVLSPTPALLHALIQQETGPPKTTYNRTVKGSCGALQSEPGREDLRIRKEPGREDLRIRKEPGREGLVGPYSQSQDERVSESEKSQDERVLWGLTVRARTRGSQNQKRARTRGSCGALQSEPGQNGPLTELLVVVRLQVQLEDNTSKKYGKGIRESENDLIPFHEQHAK